LTDPRARPLRRSDLVEDPFEQFANWYAEAGAAGEPLPAAVALATASLDGRPSARMVLLKGVDDRGFSFYSGWESRKARELEQNPRAALCFYWHEQGRQVRVEGVVGRLPAQESDDYFATRPCGAQLSAATSRQSEVVKGRDELEAAVADLRSRFPEGDVPRPAHWGGFVLAPDAFEFWQHREDRLHDRFHYSKTRGGWLIERLAP
jgi:pyridoxamine 5'-phosphate oxidase